MGVSLSTAAVVPGVSDRMIHPPFLEVAAVTASPCWITAVALRRMCFRCISLMTGGHHVGPVFTCT